MRKLLPTLSIFSISLVFAAAAAAQSPTPRPSPTPDGDVVKISTNLIQIDVSVTDAKGRPITDLKQNEIEIFENGEKQEITNFSFVSSGPPAPRPEAYKERPEKSLIPLPPPAAVRTDDVRRTIALIVDDLTLSFESVSRTRWALKKFVDEQMQPGDLVAIVRTGGGGGTFQQFTTDKQILRAAIDRVKWKPGGLGGLSAFTAAAETGLEEDFAGSAEDFRKTAIVSGIAGTISYVARGIADLPGRKSAIFFSDGFDVLAKSDNGFQGGTSIEPMIKAAIDNANMASMVIYSVDSRGLQVTVPTADNPAKPSPGAYSAFLSNQSSTIFFAQNGPVRLAQGTGGLFFDGNDMPAAIKKVLNDQSYYLVGYQPDGDTFDAKSRRFNKLEVRVKREGAVVRHRNGFFNTPHTSSSVEPPAEVMTPQKQLVRALVSPFAVNDIKLSLNPLVGYDTRSGNYVRALVHVDGRDVKFVNDVGDKTKKMEFTVLLGLFGDDGAPVEQLQRSFVINVGKSGYQKILDQGFVYHFTFPVKKPGAYQFRVALRDPAGERVGSANQFVQIPDLKKAGPTVSSIVLDGFTGEEWKSIVAGKAAASDRDPMTDTADRRFTLGDTLTYAFEIYNVKPGTESKVSTKIRIFHDGKMVLNGDELPVDGSAKVVDNVLRSNGAISLANGMMPGDYVLQVIVFDNNLKGNKRVAVQSVQFEVAK